MPTLAAAQEQLRPTGGISTSMGTHHPLMTGVGRFRCYSLQTRASERYQVTLLSEAFAPVVRAGKGKSCEALTQVVEDRKVDGERLADVHLDGDGTIWLIAAIAPDGATGGYHLGVNRIQTAPAVTLNMRFGQTLSSALTPDDAVNTIFAAYDCYRFEASRGDDLIVTMRSSAFKPAVALYAGGSCEGTPISFQNEFGEGEARLVQSITNTEVYSVRARSQLRDQFGAYSLTLQRR